MEMLVGNIFEQKTIDFGCCFSLQDVLKKLDKEFNYRLPTVHEAILIDFNHQAIWTSSKINNHWMVMDKDYGARCIMSGRYGLILVERNEDERN